MKDRVVRISYHRDLNQVQSDDELARLLSADGQAAPFDRLAWWQGLADYCGLNPALTAAYCNGDHAILALHDAGSGEFQALSNWYTFRFRPIASSPELLQELARALRHLGRRVTLNGVPDEDGSAALIQSAFRAAGWLTSREECDTNHFLTVAGRSYEEYLTTRPGNLRTTLKRKSGKLETQIYTHFDPAAWAEYEAIYAESWKPEEGSPDFLRTFAQAEGAAGRLRLGVAHASGEAIAAQMWTVEGGTAWIHKLAYREAARPLSPGSVLTGALMRHVIDVDRVAEVDFGTGDDPYKRDWMEQARPRYRIDLLRPFSLRNWPVMIRRALRRGLPHARPAARGRENQP
ncbi:hypothetical protein WSK_0935 [Novosphingobium sp. Rr 2-17]|uniref:GNAT family N-acetyltransferase n=1 Tax=Novosphingobium sp. Rr 2-17 TaxID=555793 RepID=UPI00026991A9|nr:GNAT family N-acetyltransferase [Novosphingobium sp. Rr 2-17]EIZ80377.1 hypothetical protein WSK_0935 [Novosphingobium sp. Rr 2-17]